jgi:hypothetical protein
MLINTVKISQTGDYIMTIKPGIKDFLLMTTGAVFVLVITLIVLHFQPRQGSADQLIVKAKKVDLVNRIRLELTLSSEAEKSAVLAVTDQDSQKYADQARAAMTEVEQSRGKLVTLLSAGDTPDEKDLFDQFSKVFIDLKHIDNELLSLAVKNTNIKAYSLAFGPAADILKEMDSSLSRLVTRNAGSKDIESISLFAFGAQTAALRIQTLLAPHIAEESNRKMDKLEAQMAKEDLQVHKDISALAAIPKLRVDPDLKTAALDYAKFSGIRSHILALSRENTNVRSLALALGQKRKEFFVCQDIMSALQDTIQKETIPGLNPNPPSNPRSLQTGTPGTDN